MSLDAARKNGSKFDWNNYTPPVPKQPGITVIDDIPIAELLKVTDWTPFFQAWELHGHYPAILNDPVVGAQATELFNDAQKILKKIVDEKWLRAKAVIGFWPTCRIGTVNAVWPVTSMLPVPRPTVLRWNRTCPLGDTAPVLAAATVAVKVTDWP